MIKTITAAAVFSLAAAGGALAHEQEHSGGHSMSTERHEPSGGHAMSKEEHPGGHSMSMDEQSFGREGDSRKAARTIDIGMSDKMRFTPAQVSVKRGETVRFRVRNSGQVMHEMVLGTLQDLKEHAETMKSHPGMEHHEPNMAHVAPGKTETIVWQFTKAGEFYYGCLVPGHLEAGMLGKVSVK